jgi:hypothetical protein
MPKWNEITQTEKYQSLPPEAKAEIKADWFRNNLLPEVERRPSLQEMGADKVFQWFMEQPDDTGQGYVSSMLGSAGRGFGEIVPGTVTGVGALLGSEGIQGAGESLREGLEYIAPVNPIYQDDLAMKGMNVLGNVGSIMATGGIGGAAGRGLAAESIAAAGTQAAKQALARQAIQRGASSALYGTGFAQGAAQKAEENKRLGMEGPEAYLNLIGGGLSEVLPEMLPFGTALETAAARRMLGGVDEAGKVIPGIRMSAAQEALEGGTTRSLSNLSTQLTAPEGVETPGLFEGFGEAALWEGVGGAMFGAINKLGRTPLDKQTPEQKQWQAEINATPVDVAPPITPEENQKNAAEGGIPVVAPDGTVSWMPSVSEAINIQGPQPENAPSDVERRLGGLMSKPSDPGIQIASELATQTSNVEGATETAILAKKQIQQTQDLVDAAIKGMPASPTEPAVQPVKTAEAVEPEVTLNRVEQINSQKQNLDQKAQQLGFANARALNLAKLTSTEVSDQEREVLEEYGNLNKEIKELSWKDAINLPESDFDVWSKTRFTPEIKSDVDLNGMGQLYLTLSGRGEAEKATQVLQKIQSSKRKANWTEAEWSKRFPDDSTSQEELDSLNQQNQEWNDGIDSMLSILQEQTSPEVTPSLPETELQPVVDQEATAVTMVQAAPLSEGAERNRAVIAEAAAKLRGEAPKDLSAGLQAAIPQQTQQENALPVEISNKSLLREERPEMELQGMGEQNAQPEEVATEVSEEEVKRPLRVIIPDGATAFKTGSLSEQLSNLTKEANEAFQVHGAKSFQDVLSLLKGAEGEVQVGKMIPPSNGNPFGQTKTGRPYLVVAKKGESGISDAGTIAGVVINAADDDAPRFANERKTLEKAGVLVWTPREYMQWANAEVASKPQQPITPTKAPTPATEGMLTPGGVGKRDATKVEQMTPEDLVLANKIQDETTAQVGARSTNELRSLEAKMLQNEQGFQDGMDDAQAAFNKISDVLEARDAIDNLSSVSAYLVDAYGITLPEGYVKQGDLYIFKPGATGEPVQAAPSAAQAVKATAPGPVFQRVASEMDTMSLKDLSEYAEQQGIPRKEAVGFARDYIAKWSNQIVDKANGLFGRSIKLGFFPSKISKDGMKIVASGRGLSHKHGIEVDDSQSPLHAAWVAAHEFAHQIFPTAFLPKEASLAKGTHPKGLDDIKSKSKSEKLASDFANWLVSKEYPEHANSIPSIPSGMRDYFESLIQPQTATVATPTETAAPSAKGAAVASVGSNLAGGRSSELPEATPQKAVKSTGKVLEGGSLKRSKPRESIVFKNPIKTPLGDVVGYSWSSQLVEDVDNQGEPILRRISNWDEAANNAETGRDIVHRFLIRKPDGSASEVSLESTLGKMSPNDKKTVKMVISTAKRLPFMRAELAELQALQKQADAEYQRVQKLNPDPSKLELRTPDVNWLAEKGDKVAYLDGVFLGFVESGDLNSKGELSNKARFIYENAWKWRDAQIKTQLTETQKDRIKSLERRIKKAESLLSDQNVTVSAVAIEPTSLAESGPPDAEMKTPSVTTERPAPITNENPSTNQSERESGGNVGVKSTYPSKSATDRSSLGTTGKQIIDAWRSMQGTKIAPGETVVGWDVNNGGRYAFINDRLVKLQQGGKAFTSTYTEATDKDWQDVSDSLDRGAFQVEVRKITGLGGYQKSDSGKTVRVLHQATGRPLQEFLETPDGAAWQKRMDEAVANRGPKTQETQSSTKENARRILDGKIAKLPERARTKIRDAAEQYFNGPIKQDGYPDFSPLTQLPIPSHREAVVKSWQEANPELLQEARKRAASDDRKTKQQEKEDAAHYAATTFKNDREEEAELAKEIKKGEEVRRARRSVIDPAKTNIVYGKVTTANVEAARRQLQNSGEIPNAILTRIYASPEAFLADRSNQRYFPAAYARIMAEPNVEGLYADKTTFVFASNVGVSDLDRGIAEARGISAEQAAARRVIAHENGHRGVDLFEPWELREFRSFVNRTYTTEEIDNLVRLYTEFADWRTNPVSRNEALEEIFQKKFERLVKIPTGGLWDDIVQFLKRVWRRLTGRKGDPTLDNMKDVVRLLRNAMRRAAVPPNSYTTKDGGEVKLSYAGEKAIENLPEERRQFMRDSLETAKAMAAAGKDSEEIRAVTGWFPGKYDGKMRWEVPDDGASLKTTTFYEGRLGDWIEHPELFKAYPQAAEIPVSLKEGLGFGADFIAGGVFNADGSIHINPSTGDVLSVILHEIQHWIQSEEGLPTGSNPILFSDYTNEAQKRANAARDVLDSIGDAVALKYYLKRDADNLGEAKKIFRDEFNREPHPEAGQFARFFSDDEIQAEADRAVERLNKANVTIRRGSAMNQYMKTAGEIEARDVQARQKLTPEQRKATAPYSNENIAPEDAIVMFGGSGAQMSVAPMSEQDAEYFAAVEAGDMEKAQRMVDEAARAAGYDTGWFHGRKTNWTVYDPATDKFGGLYITKDRRAAEAYSRGKWEGSSDNVPEGANVLSLAAKLGNSLKIDTEMEYIKGVPNTSAVDLLKQVVKARNELAKKDGWKTLMGTPVQPIKTIGPEWKMATSRKELWGAMTQLGISGKRMRSILRHLGYDSMSYYGHDGIMDFNDPYYQAAIFDPNQIKSADPVTYDNAGKVIPLSQRFQSTSPDIRFSRVEYENKPSLVINPRASSSYSGRGVASISPSDNSARAQAIREGVSRANWDELSTTQRAKALEEFGLKSISSRYSFDAAILPVRLTNERTDENRPASVYAAEPSPAIAVQFDASGLSNLLSGDAVTAFAAIYDIAQEEVIHTAQHLNSYAKWQDSGVMLPFEEFEVNYYTSMLLEMVQAAGAGLSGGDARVANIIVSAWNLYNPNVPSNDVNQIIGNLVQTKTAPAFTMEIGRQLLQFKRQDFTTETGWMRFVEAMKGYLADAVEALKTSLSLVRSGQAGEMIRREIQDVESILNRLETNPDSILPDAKPSRVEYASDYSAASSAGAQLARDTVYDDRIIKMRDAIRRAYEQSSTEAGVAMPIDELYAKAKELVPEMTESEFGNILQDLYEDNGAVLQEGDIGPILTEEDSRYLKLAEDEEGNREELQAMVISKYKEFVNNHVRIGDNFFPVTYIRFGNPPKDQYGKFINSTGFDGGIRERGVSVIGVWYDPLRKKYVIPSGSEQAVAGISDLVIQNRPAFVVSGKVLEDVGADTEPLMEAGSVRIEKKLDYSELLEENEPNFTLDGEPYDPGQEGTINAYHGGKEKWWKFKGVELPSTRPIVRDSQGNIIPLSKRFGDAPKTSGQINVFTPEGRRAGFAVIMPKRAVASRVETEGEAVDEYKKKIEAINSNSLNAFFGGVQMKGASPQVRTVKPSKSYEQASIDLANDLTKDGTPIEDIAESLFSDEFLQGLGIKLDIPALVSLIAEVKNRVSNQSRDEKVPGARRIKLQKLDRKLAGYWQDLGTNSGRSQGIRSYIKSNPRYSWMFIFDRANENLEKEGKLAATRVASDLPQTADNLQKTDAKVGEDAGEQAADEFEESEDEALLREGESALDSDRRGIWERIKDVLRKLGIVARAKRSRVANAAKASISKEERDAISQMSDAELAKLESDLLSEFDRLSEAFFKGGTEQQKATREKMVATAKKRAEQGKSIEPKQSAAKEKLSGAERTAQNILKDLSERYADPNIYTDAKRAKINEMRELYKKRVKQGVGPEQMSEQDFVSKAVSLGANKLTAETLWKAAELEIEAREAMRQEEVLGKITLEKLQREISALRPGEQTPFSKQIPWRKLLSQKASTVETYRQRIFDTISSEESLSDLDEAQKAKLADLLTQAWESKRKAILDRMVDNVISQEQAAGRLTKEGADALRSQRQKLVEDINLGILDEDRLMKHLADKFGIKSEFTEAERANIDRLLDILQDDKLNEVKRNKAAYELLEALSSATKIPIAKLLADYWVSSVLSGVNTATSIALAVASGAYELTSGAFRVLRTGFTNPKELPAEIAASFKAMAEFLKAFGREGRLAWQYLVTGDRAFLDPSMNTVLNDLNYDSIGKTVSLAEKMAKSDKIMQRVMGIWMRSVSRLLTALDSFNSGVTKAGALPIVFRQLDLSAESLKQATEKYNLQLYRDRVIERDFNGNKPTTAHDKALVDSYAKAEMMADLQEFGKFSENADFFGQQGAMTLDPTGIGGFIYSSIKSLTGGATNRADKFLAEAQREWKQADGADKTAKGLQLAFAYFLQFGAYNSANLAGLRFARFAGNKFNQGLSFIPGIGMLRMYEATAKDSKIEAKDAFTDMIMRNQTVGLLFAIIGAMALKAITDEPDDEKRGWFINGGWANLTPERKQQKLAAGQKEFTIGIGGKVYNYQNWPISPILAAIGSLSDLIRFSPEQWNEKSVADRLVSAAASGVFSAGEIPALSGFQTLFGNNLSSKDPNEKRLDRFAKVMAGWGGGFVPRILKDIDFMTDPGLRKYETLWEQTASHIPVYRRHIGEEYYDILGKQIERKVWPGSREFMELETAPEYRTLGKLNSRGIWLTPANAEHRMVGKGRFKRKLTQEEADAYSLETGKGYRQMLLRYGSRLEQMPTERARAFLMDKADEVRDRALQKITR